MLRDDATRFAKDAAAGGAEVELDIFQEGVHSGIPESPVPLADLADADVIAVTHAGYDHRGQALERAQAGHAVLVCGSALFSAAMKADFPPDQLAVMVSGVEFQYRDITLKSLPARHESTMTIDGTFIADQPQSFMLTVIPVHHDPGDPDPAQLAAELTGSGIEVAALDFGATWTAPRK